MPSLALAAILLSSLSAAAHAITLTAVLGFGTPLHSRYRPDDWAPLSIYVAGPASSGAAQLQVTLQVGDRRTVYTRNLNLLDGPANDVERFALPLSPPDTAYQMMFAGGTPPTISAQLVQDGRAIAGRIKIPLPAPVASKDQNVLALTRNGSGLSFLSAWQFGLFHRYFNRSSLQSYGQQTGPLGIDPNGFTNVLYPDPQSLPDDPQAYAMVDAVALAGMPLETLTATQLQALRDYVRSGGLLIVTGGNPVPLRSAFYSGMLPIQPDGSLVVPNLGPLAQRYRAPLKLNGGVTLVAGTLAPGSSVLMQDSAGHPLLADRAFGAGIVVQTAFDYMDPAIIAWPGAAPFWRDLLSCGPSQVSARNLLTEARRSDGMLRLYDALAGARARAAPPFTFLIGFCIAYLILLVPVNFLVLRKIDRREWTWLTAPTLVVLFSLVAYLYARNLKGGNLSANRAVVLETHAGQPVASGWGIASIYSPDRASYNVELASASPQDEELPSVPEEIATSSSLPPELDIALGARQDTIVSAQIPLWDTRTFAAPVVANIQAGVDATVSFDPGSRVARIRVTNHTPYWLDHCGVVSGSDFARIPDLGPGESAETRVTWATATGNQLNLGFAQGQMNFKEGSAAVEQGLSAALESRGSQPGYYFTTADTGTGAAPVAFVGWFNRRLMDVSIDGKPATGSEGNLLLVHLRAPADAPAAFQRAGNPFTVPPVTDLAPQPQGPPGVFR